ncbi:DUF4249 family protein [Tunicatimonas pelagia]|uniref:DUF4249 family protein n=1 Tax=Tunicatimonas pelagia TaxID=931531 RepID=UPI002665FA6B|nr:DUF4249 family protein [Tunicatimonas pelagia]WKN44571.1 DUF4249 family protein [Tunicatimonas pelagia]
MRKDLINLLIFFLTTSCTQEVNMPFPTFQEELVLNSILHPDSLIKLSLTKSLPLGSTTQNFPVVSSAEMRLYENDILIGEPTFQDSLYTLNYYPQSNKKYSIEVEVSGFPTLRASDVVPARPIADLCYQDDPVLRTAININIVDDTAVVNSYWLGATLLNSQNRVCEDGTTCNVNQPHFRSFSSLPDRFNAYIDAISGGITEYRFFVRIEDTGLEGDVIALAVESFFVTDNLPSDRTYQFDVHNASRHYDRFLKSGILYAINQENYSFEEDGAFTPFSEVIQTYSNVENGTGIFASYNSASFAVEDHPCE